MQISLALCPQDVDVELILMAVPPSDCWCNPRVLNFAHAAYYNCHCYYYY